MRRPFDSPPPGGKLRCKKTPGAITIELSPEPWVWRQWVRVSDAGIEAGVDLQLPWGSYPTSELVPWTQVNQIIIQPTKRGRRKIRRNAKPDEFPMIQERSVCVFRSNGVFLELGSDFDLGGPALTWLRDGLWAWGAKRGRRIFGEL
ncbi:MAG: hypothetical protein HY925_01780 [Elusimicrobia bacterium]|nr:hypothetical protein [Elusimicrobiota bacterium]